MITDLLVLLVQGPDRGQLPWWQSMCQARDVAFYQPGWSDACDWNVWLCIVCLFELGQFVWQHSVYLHNVCLCVSGGKRPHSAIGRLIVF